MQQDYIQPITSSSGLYFDYLGTLKINNAQLKIVIPVDISHFNSHIQNIKKVLETTEHLCGQTRINEIDAECYNMIQPLTVRYHDLDKGFESISHLLNNKAKRSAWFGGVGTAFKHIFGTLDEDDALKYDQAIESVQGDIKQLASLMKENILVTTSVLSYYNESLNRLINNEVELKNAIDNLSSNIRNISETTNGLRIWSNLNKIFDSLESSILALSFQLEDVTNAILFSGQNILHPSIITPQQLHRELADNYRHLPSSLELPVSLDINSIYIILRLCKIVCYYSNNKIIFLLQIPLVNVENHLLYHSIALPTPHNAKQPNSFGLIIPSSKYIAMTRDKTHYCNIDSVDSCVTVQPGTYICDVPNVYSSEAKPSCESELMSKVISAIPQQCDTKFIFGNLDIWKPLQNNKWIFIQSEPSKVSIDCANSKLHEITILGTGILTLPDSCTAFCKSTTLIPKYDAMNITSPINHIPDFNLINDSCCSFSKFNSIVNDASPIQLQNIDLDEINSKNKLITDSILKDVTEITQKPHIIKYGTHYSSLVLILFTLIFFYIIYLVYKRFRRTRSLIDNRPENVNSSRLNPKSRMEEDNEIELDHFAPIRTNV